ncbi:hypothetical protein V9Y54_13990, partial [Klebsiella pneumoniae]
MNGELIWVLSLLAIAVVLFATGKVRMDAIALMVIVAFVLSGTLTLNEAFSGFSDPNCVSSHRYCNCLRTLKEGLPDVDAAYRCRLFWVLPSNC